MTTPRATQRGAPRQIEINGVLVPITWESIGQVPNEFGELVEYYIPVFPAGTPIDPNLIWGNVWTYNATTQTIDQATPEDLTSIQLPTGDFLSPDTLRVSSNYHTLRQELLKGGISQATLELPDVEQYLQEQSGFQQGGKIEESFIFSLIRQMGRVQTNPAQASQILGIQKQMTREDILREEAFQRGESQAISNLASGVTAAEREGRFTSELELRQATASALEPNIASLKARSYRAGTPADQARQAAIANYEQAQKRIAEIQAGGAQGFTPETIAEGEREREEMLAAQEKARKQQREAESERQFRALSARSRLPTRITRL